MHHIVMLLLPAWGHTTSYIHLALRMLKLDPDLCITIVQHSLIVSQMEAEIATCSFDTSRLEIVGVGDPDTPFSPTFLQAALGQVVSGFLSLLPQFVIPDGHWPSPRTFHIDMFVGSPCVEPIRQVAPDSKIVMWFSSGAVSLLAHLADHDHEKIATEIFEDDGKRRGRTFNEILDDLGETHNGTDKLSGAVLKYPGAPDMYDWEATARGTPAPEGFGRLLVSVQQFGRSADGIALVASPALEAEGILKTREYYLKEGKEIFCVGPQVHEEGWAPSGSSKISDERLESFLKKAVDTHGPKSVLYISFGSLFFPLATPHLVRALVETLLGLEQTFPFVFALGGKMASLPPDLIEKVNSSGKGLICGWVPQRHLLQSGAIGWFLTHGGFNSISESLSQGIPLIVWPVNAEQPLNAALLSSGPQSVAFELFQIRTGSALAPTLRYPTLRITGTEADAVSEFQDVFKKARGSVGIEIKKNAEKAATDLKASREGEDMKEVARLATF